MTSNPVLFALVPPISIAIAYAFELGGAAYFEYPFDLVSIDAKLIFFSFTTFSFLAPIVFYAISIAFGTIDNRSKIIRHLLLPLLISMGVCFPILLLSNFNIIGVCVYIICVAFYSVVGIFCWHRSHQGDSKETDRPSTGTPKKTLELSVQLISLGMWFLGIAFCINLSIARNKTEFQIFEYGGDKFALVAIYGERAVGVPFKNGKPQPGRSITVNLSSIDSLEFQRVSSSAELWKLWRY